MIIYENVETKISDMILSLYELIKFWNFPTGNTVAHQGTKEDDEA